MRPGAAAALALVVLVHAWLLGVGSPPPPPFQGRSVTALQVRTLPPPAATPRDAPAAAPAQAPATARAGGPESAGRPASRRAPGTLAATSPAAQAGDPAAASDGAAAGGEPPSPVPVYRTQLAPPVAWTYQLRRAGRDGTARLQWQHDGERYEARLAGGPGGEETLQWRSTGAVDAAGLAPSRFVDRRDRRSAAANFDREAGRIGYSGRDEDRPLYPGSQDRLSLLLQLAAILQGRRSPAAVGEEVLVHVSGARGDAAVWRFEVHGPERVSLPDGSVRFALKLVREPAHAHDLRVQVWADPAAHHLPLRVRMDNGPHEFELLLQEMTDTR